MKMEVEDYLKRVDEIIYSSSFMKGIKSHKLRNSKKVFPRHDDIHDQSLLNRRRIMLYPYECLSCLHYWEVVKPHTEHKTEEYCPKCMDIGARIFTKPMLTKMAVDEYNPALGCWTRGKKDIIEKFKRAGVENPIEVGNECPDKIYKNDQKTMKEKPDKNWQITEKDIREVL